MTTTDTDEDALVHSFTADGPIYLDARLRASSLSITAEATDRVTVTVTLAPGAHTDTDPQEVIVEYSADTLRIEVPKAEDGGLKFGPFQMSNYSSHHYQIDVQIPEGSSMNAQAGSGSITAAGWLESASCACGSGRISIDDAREVHAKSGSGQIEVNRVGKLAATAGSGDITVSSLIEGRLTAGSGDIRVTSAEAELELQTGSGDMRLGQIAEASAIAGSGDITIRALNGQFSAKTGSGNITVHRAVEGLVRANSAAGNISVGIPSGTAVLQDCSTITGKLSSALSHAEGPAETDDHRLELRARTVSGNIAVHRA